MGCKSLQQEPVQEFDPVEADILYRQVRIDLSKERPDSKAYLWLKKHKPKVFAKALNYEQLWSAAVDASDMKGVIAALAGMKGAWLHGYRAYEASASV